jgi:glutathione S-transferase
MKIYQAVVSPFAVRVRIALYAKGLTAYFAPPPDGFGSEAFRQITPMGKVPTLVCDDGTVIAESAVINEYLEETYPAPALLPADRNERARARMVTQMTDAYVFGSYLPLFAVAKAEGKDSGAVLAGMQAVAKGLAALERTIDADGYAVGDDLSLADCALAPALFYITEYAEGYMGVSDPLAAYPTLQKY